MEEFDQTLNANPMLSTSFGTLVDELGNKKSFTKYLTTRFQNLLGVSLARTLKFSDIMDKTWLQVIIEHAHKKYPSLEKHRAMEIIRNWLKNNKQRH